MNIIEIKTGNYYDSDYSEYHFKTTFNVRKIFDENLNHYQFLVHLQY